AGRLALTVGPDGAGTATTPVFIPEEAREMRGYYLYASPTLHPGQTVTANLETNDESVEVTMVIRVYGASDAIEEVTGPSLVLVPGEQLSVSWTIPELDSRPIA